MYTKPDKLRLTKLDLTSANLGDHIMFCPQCDFQLEPNAVMKPICPECGFHLHTTTLTNDLILLQ